MINDYRFVTKWQLPGTVEQIYETLEDIPLLLHYWPSLYRRATVLDEGDGSKGKTVAVVTKGFLPYELYWTFRVTETHHFSGFSIEAWGDVDGRGQWIFEQNDGHVNVTYIWEVLLKKWWLKYFFFLRPLLALNHTYVMRQGEKGIRQALLEQSR